MSGRMSFPVCAFSRWSSPWAVQVAVNPVGLPPAMLCWAAVKIDVLFAPRRHLVQEIDHGFGGNFSCLKGLPQNLP